MAIYGTRNLEWKGDTLRLCGKGSPVVTIVPDGTDMVNRTRAKDAATSIALGILNARPVEAA